MISINGEFDSGRGFTLIELLVVIFIIGIVLTFATITPDFKTERDLLAEEAARFITLTKLAEDQSIIKIKPIAISFYQHGYHFMIWHQSKWLIINDVLLKSRTFNEKFRIEFEKNKAVIQLEKQDKPEYIPHLIFLPDGQNEVFSLKLFLLDDPDPFIISRNQNYKMEYVDVAKRNNND